MRCCQRVLSAWRSWQGLPALSACARPLGPEQTAEAYLHRPPDTHATWITGQRTPQRRFTPTAVSLAEEQADTPEEPADSQVVRLEGTVIWHSRKWRVISLRVDTEHKENCPFSRQFLKRTENVIKVQAYSKRYLEEGTRVRVKGSWDYHPTFGLQLLVGRDHSLVEPRDEAALLKVLRNVLGVDKVLSARLVNSDGAKALLKVLDSPDAELVLQCWEGIGETRAREIVNVWRSAVW